MADYHLGRDGEELGVFPAHEIREGLLTGRFLPTDLAWAEGMADWVELAALDEFVPQPAAGTPPLPGSAPGGARSAGATAGDAPAEAGPPFEVRGESGLLLAVLTTISLVLTRPRETFATMKRTAGYGPPILFLLVVGWPITAISQLFFADLGGGMDFMSQLDLGGHSSGIDVGADASTIAAAGVLAYPFFAVFGQFVGAGIVHLALLAIGGANEGYQTTFRVSCYTSGAAAVFSLLPVLGPVLVLIWGGLICQTIGISAAHRISVLRSLIAILVLPILFFVVVALGLVAGFSL